MIKKLFFTLSLFVSCSNNDDNSEKVNEPKAWEKDGWNLVWHDEFDDDQLDLTKWSHEIGGHGFGNNELQYYTDSDTNSFLRDGNLVIKANVVPQGVNSSKGLRYYIR